jgi:hypothetical protein
MLTATDAWVGPTPVGAQAVRHYCDLICMGSRIQTNGSGAGHTALGAHEVDLEHGDELLDRLDHTLGGVGAGADARRARHPVLGLVHRRPRPHQILPSARVEVSV